MTTIAIIPAIVVSQFDLEAVGQLSSISNALVASTICAVAALLLFRRLGTFPGITSFGQILPSVAIPYLTVTTIIVTGRLDYSRPLLGLSAVSAMLVLSLLWIHYRRKCLPTVFVMPGTAFRSFKHIHVSNLTEPIDVPQNALVAADLTMDYSPRWERFLLRCALLGVPVFHAKTLQESLAGKVEIEHLSENTFGSILPSHSYMGAKHMIDWLVAAVGLALVWPVMVIIAILIKLESAGGAFFVQERMGHRGVKFRMYKFRTMQVPSQSAPIDAIAAAKTQVGDLRITGIGRFLRRSRLDELPQILNILRGEMSWIGPRPEAAVLSVLYHDVLPFYGYRHVVRPGLTGWAQINQGHVSEVEDVREKLFYDFYYIKYFSAWLDCLIILRTIKTGVLGTGAR